LSERWAEEQARSSEVKALEAGVTAPASQQVLEAYQRARSRLQQ
jgi:hypothetical protein